MTWCKYKIKYNAQFDYWAVMERSFPFWFEVCRSWVKEDAIDQAVEREIKHRNEKERRVKKHIPYFKRTVHIDEEVKLRQMK